MSPEGSDGCTNRRLVTLVFISQRRKLPPEPFAKTLSKADKLMNLPEASQLPASPQEGPRKGHQSGGFSKIIQLPGETGCLLLPGSSALAPRTR